LTVVTRWARVHRVTAIDCVVVRGELHTSLPILLSLTDTATARIYTLSLHDALPIFPVPVAAAIDAVQHPRRRGDRLRRPRLDPEDRKSTRLNSSHVAISYAGCCLKIYKAGSTRNDRGRSPATQARGNRRLRKAGVVQ